MKNKKEIPLYYDLTFKNVFGTERNKKNTQMLLEDFFGYERGKLDGLTIKNSVNITPEVIQDKSFEMDIVVDNLPDNAIINLEAYTNYDEETEIKSFFYIARLFGTQLEKGQDYNIIRKIIQMNIVKGDKVHKSKEAIRRYRLTNDYNLEDKLLEDHFEIFIIDIDKSCKIDYNINKLGSETFEKWLELFKTNSKKEREKLLKKYPELKGAIEEMERFNNNEYIQNVFTKEMLHERQLKNAERKGYNNKALEIAKSMLKDNEDINKIIRYTKLSKEEIEKLKQDLF